MEKIPPCRFVNKGIDLKPKFDISEIFIYLREIFRQTRKTYYQQMAS